MITGLLGALALAGTPTPAPASDVYVLSEGDVVEVQVYGEEELSRSVRVGADCGIELQLVGQVQACEQSPGELADALTAALATYLREPRVTVTVTEFGGKTIEVKGAIERPGLVVLNRRTRLSEAISAAGGPSDPAVIRARLIRDNEVVEVDLLSLDNGAPVWLEDGDVVSLLPPAQVFVVGEVDQEGPVPYRSGLTVSQALSLAGGTGKYAGNRALIVRGDSTKLKVNLRRIRVGRQKDQVLQPDDTLLVRRAVF